MEGRNDDNLELTLLNGDVRCSMEFSFPCFALGDALSNGIGAGSRKGAVMPWDGIGGRGWRRKLDRMEQTSTLPLILARRDSSAFTLMTWKWW